MQVYGVTFVYGIDMYGIAGNLCMVQNFIIFVDSLLPQNQNHENFQHSTLRAFPNIKSLMMGVVLLLHEI